MFWILFSSPFLFQFRSHTFLTSSPFLLVVHITCVVVVIVSFRDGQENWSASVQKATSSVENVSSSFIQTVRLISYMRLFFPSSACCVSFCSLTIISMYIAVFFFLAVAVAVCVYCWTVLISSELVVHK